MRVIVKPGTDTLEVASWEAIAPDGAIAYLKKQLAAAAAIWPELENVQIVDQRTKVKSKP